MSKLPIPRPVASRPHLKGLPHAPASHPQVGRANYRSRSVGMLVPSIAKKVFEKFGFSTATLLTDWAVIVGADFAAYTAPERLKWPRGFEGAGGSNEPETGRPGATLMLRVEPARALDVQYKARLLTDRINAYFGYRAVADIRIIQAPLLRPKATKTRPAPVEPLPAEKSAARGVDDEELRTALAALEASIIAETAARKR